jgi:hypothetical protein
MSLRIRRGTAAELTTIAPEEGELIYTTDTKKLYVGDGATFGGIITSGSGSVLINGTKSVSLASTGVLTVTGSIVPDANITYDLGTATNRFRDIYLSSSTINLGGNALSVDSSGLLAVSETVGGEGVGGIASVQWATGNVLRSRTDSTSEFIAKYESLKVGDKITLLTGQSGAFTNTVLTVSGQVQKSAVVGGSYFDFVIPVNSSPVANVFVYRFTLTRVTGAPTDSINLGGNTVSVDSSGLLTVSETFSNIVSGGDIALAQWNTSKEFRVTAKLALANKFDSLKIGDQILQLSSSSSTIPATTVLTVTNLVTKTLVQGGLYYDFVIPVSIAASALTTMTSFTLKTAKGATQRLEYFGGEGFGPRDATSLAWGFNGSTWGNAVFRVQGPGAELRIAIYNLKIGDSIRINNPPFNYVNDTLTITGTATEVTPGFIQLQVDRAPLNSNPNYVYALYLPVRDTSATIANGTKNLTVLPSGNVVFPTATVPAHSYGAAGDVAGMVAFDSTYIYYCTANYVNNSTNIWKRTAHGTGTW